MNENKIEMRWDDFETNAPNTFRKLWNDQDFADVTLATEDNQQIRAHKVILSSCSEFFRNIFLKNPHQNPLLYLKGIRYKELAMVIQFIYLGQCDMRQYELQDFLTTGNNLDVGGLIEDVKLKDIEEPVVENGTHNAQEPQEPDPNDTDIDDTTWEMSPQSNEREVILPSNQQEGGRFVCNECNAKFGTNSDLLIHRRSKHEGLRYECNQCDSTFTRNTNLTTHKQSKHEGVRYKCHYCDYRATYKQHLTTHKQSKHEGVKYECILCDYKATQLSNLTTHKQTKHEGLRYKCDHCDYKATQQGNLTTHKQSKHEGLIYECDHCHISFSLQDDLTRHKQSQHE